MIGFMCMLGETVLFLVSRLDVGLAFNICAQNGTLIFTNAIFLEINICT